MYAVLSLDLDKVTTTQRDKFYESLKNNQWIKINNLTTTWYVNFKEDATESGMRSTANVQNYNAMLTVSKNKPTEFSNKIN